MPTWPTNKPNSNRFNSDSDSIKQSRVDLKTMSDAVNDIVDFIDTSAIANNKILKYNSTSGKLEFVTESGGSASHPLLIGEDIVDSAGSVVGMLEFEGDNSASYSNLTITTTESNQYNKAQIVINSGLVTDNGVSIKTSGKIGGNNISNDFQFNATQILLESGGLTNQGIQVRSNQLIVTGPPGSNVNYPVPSIGSEAKDFYIGNNIGSDLNNGESSQLPASSETAINGAVIYFDHSEGNIYINTRRSDSAGDPDDGNIYLNQQKWPNADGTNGQFLSTNGSGVLSWSTAPTGPNLWATVTGDSGSTTANTTTDTLEIRGGSDIGTSVSGDVLTINFTGSAGGGGITDINGGANITVTQDSAGGVTLSQETLSNPLNMNDQQLTNLAIKNYGEIVYTGGGATGTITPDPNDGSVQKITLTGSITLNSLASVASGDSMTLIVQQPASGGPYTLSSTMKFAGGTKTLSTAADAIDVITIFYDGTNYLASLGANFS